MTNEPDVINGYSVTCPDGFRRHIGLFATRELAREFADLGHVCLARHTITEIRPYPDLAG